MPRRMSEAPEREWSELFAFFEYWVTAVAPVQLAREHPAHPLNYVNALIAKAGRSKAFDGLKQAIGDILEASQDVRGAQLAQLDSKLASQGLLTLSYLRKTYRSKYDAVLKRGVIRNEAEYHLLMGVANDTSTEISIDEREQLDRLLAGFEAGAARQAN
jgi:hypothetical protein